MTYAEILSRALASPDSLHDDTIFIHLGPDSRFSNISIYKLDNKAFTKLHTQARTVPHTLVWMSVVYDLPAILWTRRQSVEQIREAVASLLMTERNRPVILRAFDPEKQS